MDRITLDDLKNLPLYYEEGGDDPYVDIRCREGPFKRKACEILTDKQLRFVHSCLGPDDRPVRFFSSWIWGGACQSLEIGITLERMGKPVHVELYFSTTDTIS